MKRIVATVLTLVCGVAACGSDAAAPTTTRAPDTATVETVSTVPATSSSSSTTTTTTVPAPPTTSIEDLEARIAADYERAFFLRYELLAAPSLDNLEANVAEIAVTGSPAFEPIVKGIRDLVAAGDRVVPNDPDILTVTIENVELVGDAPYSEAIVTACMVSNRKQVTPAENSPVSSQIDVVGSGDLAAIRIPDPVRLTDGRWLRYATRVTAQEYQGQDTCPAP